MVSSPLTQHTAWSHYDDPPSYRPNDGLLIYQGRLQRSLDRIPLVFTHGFTLSGSIVDAQRDGPYQDDFRAIAAAAGFPVLVGDLGGSSTWGNDDAIDAVDDMLDYVDNPAGNPLFRVRSDKVALLGESMGGLLALNWAWRNPEQVVAIILRAPVVALESFYNDNASFQGPINGAYGGTLDAADLDAHDPMRNIDLIRPFGHRIKVWAMEDDEFVNMDDVLGFATLVGAEFDTQPGTHIDALNIDPGLIATFLLAKSRERATFYWDWPNDGWGQLQKLNITSSGLVSYTYNEGPAPGGRRGYAAPIGISGPGNDRAVYIFPDFEAVDTEMFTTIHSGDPGVAGQQGNFHRIIQDAGADTAAAYVIWQNIFGASPWILNVGVWAFKPVAALLDGTGFDTNQSGSFTPAGLVRQTGGTIFGSSRTSNVATLIVEFETTPHVGDIIEVVGTSFAGPRTVTGVTETTITFASVGADITVGGSGYFGNHSRTFPYYLRTQVRGASANIKAWKGDFEPSWSNPDFAATVAFEGGHHTGYGANGILIAHGQANNYAMGQGSCTCTEL